jgi:endonuclease/exonuclease/phosphatase family metal-dependent hydrolase
VIDRVERGLRDLRRAVSRSRWFAGLRDATVGFAPRSAAPGLLIVQIDGLSAHRLRSALAGRLLPFTARLLGDGELRLVPVYSGVPSTTPAVQAELFYGARHAVPGFAFVERASGRLFRMYQHDAATAVEAALVDGDEPSLLAGGASYANVYTGGAADARFCMASLGVGDFLPKHRRWLIPAVVVAHVPDLLRLAALAVAELAAAPRDLLSALRAGEDTRSELKFVQSRVAVGVVLRELTILGITVDLARGLPVVHGNLLGYDENAHRRGPGSPVAARALRATDAAVARLWKAAHRTTARSYDVWVMSDHGQEVTDPYVAQHGETVASAVHRVAGRLGLLTRDTPRLTPVPVTPVPLTPAPTGGVAGQRSRLLGERIVARIVPGLDVSEVRHEPGSVTVTAQGPLGHVYAPRALAPDELDAFAAAIVEEAQVPLVLRPADAATGGRPPEAFAYTTSGRFLLPDDAAMVLGPDHPYLAEATADLVAVCHHPDAGDLVISGWRRREHGRAVSFPFEHGAHAGPGPAETDAFALVPPDAPLPAAGSGVVVRPADLRRAALSVVGGERRPAPPPAPRVGLRVMTYNVHSCIGLDRRVSPERIARVIARHDPDIVALQELDAGRSRTGGVHQAQAIADALEMALEFHPTITLADGRFGDAVLSRHPLRLVRAGGLPGLDHPRLEPRGALWVEVAVPSGDDTPTGPGVRHVQVLNTHLSLHPVERAMASRALLGPRWLGDPAAARDVVLCGDFNALSWFPAMRRLRRRLTDVQLDLDGHRPRRTWPGRVRLGRIDHVLVDSRWSVLAVEVADHALARVASDHRPVVVDLLPARA